jgi:hypothetical protein
MFFGCKAHGKKHWAQSANFKKNILRNRVEHRSLNGAKNDYFMLSVERDLLYEIHP